MNAPIALRAGDRVLVTRLNYLGDVVLSLPMVDALFAKYPGIEVDYLTREPAASLLQSDARFARVLPWHDGFGAALSTIAQLRRRRYRAVIDLYSNPRSAWLSWFSGAPIRVGGDRRGRRRLYTHRVRAARGIPVTEVFLKYAEPFGVEGPATKPSLAISNAERLTGETILARAGLGAADTSPRVGVHPGGKWPVKRWPASRFADLVELLQYTGARVVLFTGPDEAEATAAVKHLVSDRVAVLDPLGIRETAAVISRLNGMVVCDGGIMHTSVAVGTPTVGIFGSSEASVWFPYEQFGPYRPAQIEVPCRPCHKHVCPLGHTRCLNDLAPRDVLALLSGVLSTTQRSAT